MVGLVLRQLYGTARKLQTGWHERPTSHVRCVPNAYFDSLGLPRMAERSVNRCQRQPRATMLA